MNNIFSICDLQANSAISIETLIERLVEKKKQLHDLQSQVKEIETAIKIRGAASYATDNYTCKVSLIQKKTVNWKMVAAVVGYNDKLIADHSNTTEYYTLKIDLKK